VASSATKRFGICRPSKVLLWDVLHGSLTS
jgi:hypothetical protein